MTTRRNVLFGITASVASAAAGWQTETGAGLTTVMRPGTAFGTTVSIEVTAKNLETANRAIDAGFSEIRAVHRAASLFDPHSEISELNRTKLLKRPSRILRDIVQSSHEMHQMTGGAFDPSVQPLWELWASQSGKPNVRDIVSTLELVGWQHLHWQNDELSLSAGSALTFNGIAQGHAADRVMASLKQNGALRARVDTGELGLMDVDGGVLIRNPRMNGAIGSLNLKSGFAAISGDYATTFSPDFSHHHIFDPNTGFSPGELASVAVHAPTATLADGLATAFMVMGLQRSLRCLEQMPGCAALFIDKKSVISLSSGMRPMFRKFANPEELQG